VAAEVVEAAAVVATVVAAEAGPIAAARVSAAVAETAQTNQRRTATSRDSGARIRRLMSIKITLKVHRDAILLAHRSQRI
jgi:hypothetical protein